MSEERPRIALNAAPPPRQPPRTACLGGCLLLLMPVAIGVIVLLIILAENDPAPKNPPTVPELLASLADGIASGQHAVTLHLSNAIDGETILTLDETSPLDTLQDDYFCLRIHVDDDSIRRCIPYTNVTAIDTPLNE